MIFPTIILSACMVAAQVSSAVAAPQQNGLGERSSPCPDLFHYDSVNQPGQWTGTLTLLSEDDLHGLWIRLIFDNALKEVKVDGNYEVVSSADTNEVLIKNRNVLLKAGSPTHLKITVEYEGSKFPNLKGYRLNAKTLCPDPNSIRTDFFEGDERSRDFVESILSRNKPAALQPEYKCGLTPSLNSPIYPWQADIFIKQGDKEEYVCEATLISPSHVLTAAHCVTFKSEKIEVPATSVVIHLARNENFKDSQKVVVAEIKVHPGYDPVNLFNNVAVLQLKSGLTIDDNIRPICLSGEDNSNSGSVLVGYNIESNGEIGSKLVEANIKKIDTNDCAKEAPEFENLLGDNSYCVTYLLDNLNCAGDSGSSLVSYKNNVATLRGILSLGITLQNKNECNDDSIVIVTDTSRYLKWIRHVL